MGLDAKTHSSITQARLNVSSPESVYQELKDYADQIKNNKSFKSTDRASLEEALLLRNSPLINLALAEFATGNTTVNKLYELGNNQSLDNYSYAKGLRVACLANEVAGGWFNYMHPISWMGEAEFEHLISAGGDEELNAFLTNPKTDANIFGELYAHEGRFKNIPEERWLKLVWWSVSNPRLNIDESNEDGPDMGCWNMQMGIFKLLEISPLNRQWLFAIYELLTNLDPAIVQKPDGNLYKILDRWKAVSVVKGYGENKGQNEDGWWTQLSLVDEFRCLIAALYGQVYDSEKRELRLLGSSNSDDVTLRCCFYGRGTLSEKQFLEGYEKDGEAFLFAALENDSLFLNRKTRRLLESHISGDLLYRYAHRCEQIHARRKWFDPNPISDEGESLLEDIAPSSVASDELKAINLLTEQVEALQAEAARLKGYIFWGVVLLGALIYNS